MRPHKCPICGASFPTGQAHIGHKTLHHHPQALSYAPSLSFMSNERLHKCPICNEDCTLGKGLLMLKHYEVNLTRAAKRQQTIDSFTSARSISSSSSLKPLLNIDFNKFSEISYFFEDVVPFWKELNAAVVAIPRIRHYRKSIIRSSFWCYRRH
ncbi:zinc finger protein AZF2-like [Andrographis paniculata]|uniref:zinc finger protein AZF2-like n=1 Tax=Andrographis paniculata TaxID=175694 RepID=UPI0021E7C736|nr:zinc finger protein AZF2-like [Andrographis paniculata]